MEKDLFKIKVTVSEEGLKYDVIKHGYNPTVMEILGAMQALLMNFYDDVKPKKK